jgi:hypothetical protein
MVTKKTNDGDSALSKFKKMNDNRALFGGEYDPAADFRLSQQTNKLSGMRRQPWTDKIKETKKWEIRTPRHVKIPLPLLGEREAMQNEKPSITGI